MQHLVLDWMLDWGKNSHNISGITDKFLKLKNFIRQYHVNKNPPDLIIDCISVKFPNFGIYSVTKHP